MSVDLHSIPCGAGSSAVLDSGTALAVWPGAAAASPGVASAMEQQARQGLVEGKVSQRMWLTDVQTLAEV